MRESWNKTTSFEHFDVKLANTRWSWSGQSVDGMTVALVLWQDGVKGKNGNLTYDDTENPDAEWRSRPGSIERTQLLKHCRDNLGGQFRAVIAVAADIEADPRQIERCFPHKGVLWQLDEFDERTGAFSAHVVR
ncbi:hypothetical protein TomMM35A_17070 [Sphingobium sp. TomMM35A]